MYRNHKNEKHAIACFSTLNLFKWVCEALQQLRLHWREKPFCKNRDFGFTRIDSLTKRDRSGYRMCECVVVAVLVYSRVAIAHKKAHKKKTGRNVPVFYIIIYFDTNITKIFI